MLELGAGADILRAIGWLYLCLIAVLVGVALWFPQRWWQKAIGVLVVLLVFMGPAYLRNRERSQQVDVQKARYAAAKTLFDERCKTAGEKIYRTVDGIEGFVWERWRPTEINFDHQFELTDPYGRDCGGEECIKQMLRVTSGQQLNPEEARLYANGYGFIETIDPQDHIAYRYSGTIRLHDSWTPEKIAAHKAATGADVPSFSYRFALKRQPITTFTARYSVTWDDVSTPEDRNYWIAGGLIRITDRQTKEIIAERIGYLMDSGQGDKGGQRSPWTWAQGYTVGCPSTKEHNLTFIQKILKSNPGQ